jgi:DNA-binding CsgD family transcriptional regulator
MGFPLHCFGAGDPWDGIWPSRNRNRASPVTQSKPKNWQYNLRKREGPIVKKVRMFAKPATQQKKNNFNTAPAPSQFVFFQKSTGTLGFQAECDAGPDCAVERMAGMLAMQCLVRGQDPDNFQVLVPAEKSFCDRVVSRAATLLEEGRAATNPGCLSPRQKEILHSVVRQRANKEIAARLNITVRTVKFHISALLSKFGVENRSDLARRAAGMLHQEFSGSKETAGDEPRTRESASNATMAYVLPSTMKGRSVRFPRSILTA